MRACAPDKNVVCDLNHGWTWIESFHGLDLIGSDRVRKNGLMSNSDLHLSPFLTFKWTEHRLHVTRATFLLRELFLLNLGAGQTYNRHRYRIYSRSLCGSSGVARVIRGCGPHRAAIARGGKRAKNYIHKSNENSD